MSELKTKWPVWVDDPNQHDYENEIDYHSARADAAIERLRICEAVLQDIRVNAYTLLDAVGYANEALNDIGPIPGDGE